MCDASAVGYTVMEQMSSYSCDDGSFFEVCLDRRTGQRDWRPRPIDSTVATILAPMTAAEPNAIGNHAGMPKCAGCA